MSKKPAWKESRENTYKEYWLGRMLETAATYGANNGLPPFASVASMSAGLWSETILRVTYRNGMEQEYVTDVPRK